MLMHHLVCPRSVHLLALSQEAATPTVTENVVSGNSSAAADQQMSQKVSSVSAEETDGVLSASLHFFPFSAGFWLSLQ